jgi:hypothetical protein
MRSLNGRPARARGARRLRALAGTGCLSPDLKTLVEMRDNFHNALSELEPREQEVARLQPNPRLNAANRAWQGWRRRTSRLGA